jgi:hypothetical protein
VVIISEVELEVQIYRRARRTGRQESKKARIQESKSRSERVDVGSGYYCSASGIYNNGRVRWRRKEDRTLTSELDPDR